MRKFTMAFLGVTVAIVLLIVADYVIMPILDLFTELAPTFGVPRFVSPITDSFWIFSKSQLLIVAALFVYLAIVAISPAEYTREVRYR